jgi:tRNA1Val (adenine37-N6)-methyltransferase
MPANCDTESSLTEDRLLDGRVWYVQPKHGFRSGIEPVLLAAAVPARAGERVLEGGSGAGAGLLCLAARVPGLTGVGVERDAALAVLAGRNALANGWPGITFVPDDLGAVGRLGVFDHAFANPPYHDSEGTRSPVPARDSAKRAESGLFVKWASCLAAGLRHRGTLTFVLPAAALPQGLAALVAARCPARAVLPLWPRAGQAAKLVLVQGVKNGRSPLRLLAGLVLHEHTGGFTQAADSVLRRAGALPMD